MKNILIYLGLVITIVALYGFAFTIADQQNEDGKKIFVDNKCNMCHTVTAAAIESKNQMQWIYLLWAKTKLLSF